MVTFIDSVQVLHLDQFVESSNIWLCHSKSQISKPVHVWDVKIFHECVSVAVRPTVVGADCIPHEDRSLALILAIFERLIEQHDGSHELGLQL